MRITPALFSTAALLVFATSGRAQAAGTKTAERPAPVQAKAGAAIDAGMSKAQVIQHFGKPASERTRGEYTYLHYSNGMEQRVGMSDIVILQNDKVIDAVLRSPRRSYNGTSSSPRAINSREAAKGAPTPPLKVGGRGQTPSLPPTH